MQEEVKNIINSPIKDVEFIEITKNIFQVNMKTQKELCLTFLRFQEFYESPEYKDKYFTWNEYVEWYTKEQSKDKKTFDYHTTWNGFNIPSSVLKPFLEGKFDLTTRERSFLKLFEKVDGDFYIIGTHSEKDASYYDGLLKHETAHGLYSTDSVYKEKVNEILSQVDISELSTVFSSMGYHQAVHLDESHAYLMVDSDYLKDTKGIDISKYETQIEALNNLFFETLKVSNPVLAMEYYIKHKCQKAGVTVILEDSESVKLSDSISVAGSFDHVKKELVAAKKNKRYLPILIHEFNHLVQMQENCKEWRECFVMDVDIDTVIDLWLEGKVELNQEQLDVYMDRLIAVERDCEERTVKMIKEFDLDICTLDYTKKANSYLLMYHIVKQKREWCTSSPRDNDKVLSLMSNQFDMDYSQLTDEIVKAYDKTFS